MINRIIAEYIKGHKRLVVPGFGAFIRKDTGEVVLVEFLKKNDGVLITLVAERKGISEQEALDATEQYIAKVKRNVSQTGDYHIEGLGKVYVTPNGFYELEYIAPVEDNPEEVITAPKIQFPDQKIASNIGQETPRQTAPGPRLPAQDVTPKVAPKPAVADVAENRYTPNTRPTPAAQAVNPVRPYPKPVQPAQQAQPVRPAYMRPSHHQPQPQKKTDVVMVVAIIAAIIAILAIFFSSMVNGSPANHIAPVTTPVEQVSGANKDNL